MELPQALFLSLVEGVTEFLPVSSTGHLVLTSGVLGIKQTEFVKSFEIIIQLGAILSVVFLYWKTLINTRIWPQIFVAFLPSAIIGFLFYPLIKNVLIGNSLITVVALFLGGVAFILIERLEKVVTLEEIENMSLKQALGIGIFQSISVIPGVSRAGATILGALILGANRSTAAKFSFILAVPTMMGATALDVFKTKLSFTAYENFLLAIGFASSFIIAGVTVKFFVKYLTKHDFTAFGIYRIVAAILFFLIFIL